MSWLVAPCSCVICSRPFEAFYNLHLQGYEFAHNSEDGGGTVLRNVSQLHGSTARENWFLNNHSGETSNRSFRILKKVNTHLPLIFLKKGNGESVLGI
jgi:hypothetical protein